MNAASKRVLGWMIAVGLALLTTLATAAEAPFKVDELSRFIAGSVPFLEWSRTNHQQQMLQSVMDKPQAIAEFPRAVRFLQDHKWDPERFAYIFNHVMTAYQRLEMGRDPSRFLARLDQTKTAVSADATQSESEKARILAIIAEAQRGAVQTDKAFASLPAEEVRIMWLHRAELHQLLDGNLPFTPRVLPNPNYKP